jgi:hypothetical protein
MFSACCRRSENAIRLSATGAQRFVVLFSRPVIRYDNFIINAVSIKNLTLEKQLWRRPLKRTGIGEALQLAVARPRIAHLGRRVLLRCRHRSVADVLALSRTEQPLERWSYGQRF